MKSFSVLIHDGAFLFSWFGGDSVMFTSKPGTKAWVVTCERKQSFLTYSHPKEVVQETFDLLTNLISWEQYILTLTQKGN